MANTQDTAFDPMDFTLEQFLPYRLSLLTNTVTQGIARNYRDHHGITVTEWRILAVLGRFPGLTASELVEHTAVDKVAISRAVKGLEQKRLLRRETDAGDRRRMQLFITGRRGREVLGRVIPKALAYERRLLECLSNTEARTLFDLMDKLQRQAKSM